MDVFRMFYLLVVAMVTVDSAERVNRATGNNCPRIKDFSGRVKYRRRGTKAQFRCPRKTTRYGNKYVICQSDNTWSGEPPKCIKSGCVPVDLSDLENLDMTEKFGGALLTFSCEENYIILGQPEVYCDGRQWSAGVPICKAPTDLMQCDFEEDLCGWTQDKDDELEWTRNIGKTQTGSTGPKHDHTFQDSEKGHYLFMESSNPAKNRDQAILWSPVYTSDMSEMCFDFWYHILGPDEKNHVGSLAVYVRMESEFIDDLQPKFYKIGNQGDVWHRADIFIDQKDEPFQIAIVATRRLSYISDIAIDDVRLYNCSHDIDTTTTTTTTTESTTLTTTPITSTEATTEEPTSATKMMTTVDAGSARENTSTGAIYTSVKSMSEAVSTQAASGTSMGSPVISSSASSVVSSSSLPASSSAGAGGTPALTTGAKQTSAVSQSSTTAQTSTIAESTQDVSTVTSSQPPPVTTQGMVSTDISTKLSTTEKAYETTTESKTPPASSEKTPTTPATISTTQAATTSTTARKQTTTLKTTSTTKTTSSTTQTAKPSSSTAKATTPVPAHTSTVSSTMAQPTSPKVTTVKLETTTTQGKGLTTTTDLSNKITPFKQSTTKIIKSQSTSKRTTKRSNEIPDLTTAKTSTPGDIIKGSPSSKGKVTTPKNNATETPNVSAAEQRSKHPDDDTLKPLMIGLGVGIVAGLIVIGVVAWVCMRRRKFYRSKFEDELKPITNAGSSNSLNNVQYYHDDGYEHESLN